MITKDRKLIDNMGREINYLRLSVTDRCNLDCIYCMPLRRLSYLDRDEILGFEEILTLIHLFVKLGIKKIRITGGEPLLRKNVLDLIASIKRIEKIEKLALTTNGILLKDAVSELKSIGIDSVNVSLDSLDRNRFGEITGVDALSKVMSGIDEALKVGINSLKINVVLMGGINETEIIDFVNLARETRIDVRFIEYMPLLEPAIPISFLSAKFVLSKIEYPMRLSSKSNGSIAKYYEIPGFRGRIGFISPISQKFCSSCSRIRMTADGKLRACLINNQEIDLKTPLRNNSGDEAIEVLVRKFLMKKNREYNLDGMIDNNIKMSSIGG